MFVYNLFDRLTRLCFSLSTSDAEVSPCSQISEITVVSTLLLKEMTVYKNYKNRTQIAMNSD